MVTLVARHDDGLSRRHGLQRRPGHPHKEVPRRHNLVDIGAGAGHGDAGPAQLGVDLPGPGLPLFKDVAPSGDEQLDAGNRPVQLRGQLDELAGHQGPVLAHPADIGQDGL